MAQSGRRWPVRVAGLAMAVALVAAVAVWVAAGLAAADANDAETQVERRERQTAEVAGESASTADQLRSTQGQVAALEAMFQPGIAQALGGIYLEAMALGCEQGTDAQSVIDQLTEKKVLAPLADHEGWVASVDPEALQSALTACEQSGG